MSVAVQPQVMPNERHNSYDWTIRETDSASSSRRPRCATDALSRSPCFGSTGCLVSDSESTLLKRPFSLLSAEFYELKERTQQILHCSKLYLTDKELIVAKVDGINAKKKPRLLHLRTHALSEIEVEFDQADPSIMRIRDLRHAARLYIYRLRHKNGEYRLQQWVSRMNFASSLRTSMDHRGEFAADACMNDFSVFQIFSPGPSSPRSRRLRSPPIQSYEWHGVTHADIANSIVPTPSPDLEEPAGLSEVLSVPQASSYGGSPKHDPFLDLEDLQPRDRLRSHSCPPSNDDVVAVPSTPSSSQPSEEQQTELASPTEPNSRAFMSPSRHTTIRKNRLKFSPRVPKSVTRALSGHFNSISSTEITPVKSSKRYLRRSSLHSATMPRSRNKQRVKKRKENSKDDETRSEGMASNPPTPAPPATPSKLKSPGSILKIIRGRWNSSVGFKTVNPEETWLPFDETDDGSPVPIDLPRNSTKLFMMKPKEVAEELTSIDAEMFQSIDVTEIKNAAWTKNSTKHIDSPNIMCMIEWFNRLARIACTEIVQEKTVQARAKAISSYIKIASKCHQMRNYNSLKALLSALQLQAVYRLQKSWSHVPRKRRMKFDQLAKIMSEENRFENLRREMRANIASGVFFVPYLAWFLHNVITNDTLFEVRQDRALGLKNGQFVSASISGPRHEPVRRKVSGRPMSWRNSTCSVSLPSSPAHSVDCRKNKDEKTRKRGIVLSKSENDLLDSSDSCLGLAVSGSSSQLAITRSHSTQIMPSFTDTTAEGVPAATTDTKDLFVRHSAISSDSSIDEHSPQTDSAVALESLGHLSPIQQQQHPLGSSSSFAMSLPCRPRTNSILSYSDDYVLPEVEVSFGDSDADDETDNVFDSSFANHLATASLPPLNFEATVEAPMLKVNGLVGGVPPNGDSAPVTLTSILGKHLASDSNLNSLPGRSISTRDGAMHTTFPSLLTNFGSLVVPGDGDSEDAFSNDLYGFAYYSPHCGILLSSVTAASLRKRTSMSEDSCSNEIIRCQPVAPKTVFLPSNEDGEKAQRGPTEDVQMKDDKRSGPTSSSSSDAEQEPSASLSLSPGKVLPSVGQKRRSTSTVVPVPLRRLDPAVIHDQSVSMKALRQYQKVILQHSEHLSKRHRLSTLLKSMNWLTEIECLEISKQIEPNNHSL